MELNWIKQQKMSWIIVILNVMLPKMINLNELVQNFYFNSFPADMNAQVLLSLQTLSFQNGQIYLEMKRWPLHYLIALPIGLIYICLTVNPIDLGKVWNSEIMKESEQVQRKVLGGSFPTGKNLLTPNNLYKVAHFLSDRSGSISYWQKHQ